MSSAKRTKKPTRPAPDAWPWITKAQAAELTGYQVRNFSDRIQAKLETSAMRGKGAALRFNGIEVVKALATYIAEQHRPKPEDVDPLLGREGEVSDSLDEFRRESTVKLRLANAQTRRELVDRQTLLDAISKSFAAAAGLGQKLVKRYDNNAGLIWNEAIDTMRDAAIAALAEPSK